MPHTHPALQKAPSKAEEAKNNVLPIFCHSVIDDSPISSIALRVYMHLSRKSGAWGFALVSYRDLGRECLRNDFPKAKDASLRQRAYRAIRELVEVGLISRYTYTSDQRGRVANAYVINTLEEVKKVQAVKGVKENLNKQKPNETGSDSIKISQANEPADKAITTVKVMEDNKSEDQAKRELENASQSLSSQDEGEDSETSSASSVTREENSPSEEAAESQSQEENTQEAPSPRRLDVAPTHIEEMEQRFKPQPKWAIGRMDRGRRYRPEPKFEEWVASGIGVTQQHARNIINKYPDEYEEHYTRFQRGESFKVTKQSTEEDHTPGNMPQNPSMQPREYEMKIPEFQYPPEGFAEWFYKMYHMGIRIRFDTSKGEFCISQHTGALRTKLGVNPTLREAMNKVPDSKELGEYLAKVAPDQLTQLKRQGGQSLRRIVETHGDDCDPDAIMLQECKDHISWAVEVVLNGNSI